MAIPATRQTRLSRARAASPPSRPLPGIRSRPHTRGPARMPPRPARSHRRCWQRDLRPVLPLDYAALGFKSPIVTWGNGTGDIPPQYATLLGHLASYGFTVIGTTSQETGSGVEIDAAARYLVTQAGTAGSVFCGNLDADRVAAVGHSQGAGGATRAALNDPALITTLMTFSLPITFWLNGPSIALLTQPAFLISTHGIFDSVIAPPVIERIFYETLTVHATLGIILKSAGKRADHASIVDTAYGGNPGGELGYATAWLAYQLRGDTTAASAFTGPHPELVSNSNWPGSATK
jgi:pimeloyl-ACP methyl ester carboxylesterase